MSISSLGIGSGLDLNSLVDRLLAAEREPRERKLDERETNLQAQISAFGTLRSSLSQVEAALGRLSRLDAGRAATSSNETAIRATATPQADPGRYTIQVDSLAAAESRASDPFEDANAALGSGTLTIQVGDGSAKQVNITAGSDSLRGVRDAINSARAGVQASIVNDGSGARLVLTANKTGAENTISVAVNAGSSGLAGLSSLNTNEPATAAADAVATINGLAITSASNELENVIDGLTLELRGTTEAGSPVTVNVTEDRGAVRSALNDFITAYNAVVEQTNTLTRYDPETRQTSLLVGDSTVRTVRGQLNAALNQRGGPSGAAFDNLVSLGVRTGENGKLSLDEGALNRAMDRDFAATSSVINDVAGGMRDAVLGFTQKGGLLEIRTDGLQSRVRDISNQRERLEDRMEQMEARLVRQFGNLDALVGQLQNTSAFLDQQLTPLTEFAAQGRRRR